MGGVEELPFKKYGTFAIVLYHVCAFVTACDMQTVVIFMRAFEVDLGLSPSSLSVMKTAEFVSGTVCSPIWGLLVDRFVVNHVYPAGAFLGGVICILLACVSNYPFIIFLRILHGFALAGWGPIIHKIIIDSRPNSEVGLYYGIYIAVMCAASLIFLCCGSQLALTTIAGYYGWRFCYVLFGVIWFIIGILVYFYLIPVDDGIFMKRHVSLCGVKAEMKALVRSIRQVTHVSTFWILVLVTMASDAPAAIALYLMMYLQYCGLSDVIAGVACAVIAVGTFFGVIIGGFVADSWHKKSEKYGRIAIGTIVVVMRLIVISLLLCIPIKDSLKWYNWIELALFGVSALTFANVDRPMLAAVVPRENQALGVALIRVIGDLPSWAVYLPLIGFMSEKSFGYVKTRELVEDMDPLIRDGNATALRKSMVYVACFGVLCNLFLYAAMVFTYPDDFEKKKRQDMILENP